MATTPPNPLLLEYSPRSRRPRRRWLIAVALCGMFISAWRFGPPVWRQGHYLFVQRRALNYLEPPDRTVMEFNTRRVAQLIQSDPRYHRFLAWVDPTRKTTPSEEDYIALYKPPLPVSGIELPPGGVSMGCEGTVLFMHERRSPKGETRLVVIYLYVCRDAQRGYIDWQIHAFCFELASWKLGSVAVDVGRSAPGPDTDAEDFRLFAGQPDPRDASHFTIAYEAAASQSAPTQRGTIDGWLRDDDSVDLKLRDEPAKKSWLRQE